MATKDSGVPECGNPKCTVNKPGKVVYDRMVSLVRLVPEKELDRLWEDQDYRRITMPSNVTTFKILKERGSGRLEYDVDVPGKDLEPSTLYGQVDLNQLGCSECVSKKFIKRDGDNTPIMLSLGPLPDRMLHFRPDCQCKKASAMFDAYAAQRGNIEGRKLIQWVCTIYAERCELPRVTVTNSGNSLNIVSEVELGKAGPQSVFATCPKGKIDPLVNSGCHVWYKGKKPMEIIKDDKIYIGNPQHDPYDPGADLEIWWDKRAMVERRKFQEKVENTRKSC